MSEQAQPQREELKKHGDELANAFKDSGEQRKGSTKAEPATSGNKKE